MSFPDEEEAFRAYAGLYPVHPIFLIDTYDTLKSGILNAIKIGKKIVDAGGNFGVRLDSGDIQYLSTEVRKILDEAGCPKATISVSNDLDETIIATLVASKAPIDSWGVGTRLITGAFDAAFTGVYKLASFQRGEGGAMSPAIKLSDNPEKTTTPDVKQVWRFTDKNGMAVADLLTLDNDTEKEVFAQGDIVNLYHTSADYRHIKYSVESAAPLLTKKMENGKISSELPTLPEISNYVRQELETFDSTYKRLLNPHIYKISITEKLRTLKLGMLNMIDEKAERI
jgi:nicotinate phosphoribosyltransferase